MDLEFYVRVRTCEKRVTGKQPLVMISSNIFALTNRATLFHITDNDFATTVTTKWKPDLKIFKDAIRF